MPGIDLRQHRDQLWQELCHAAGQVPFAEEAFGQHLERLCTIERFWAYPGAGVLRQLAQYLEREQYALVTQLVGNCWNRMARGSYRQQALRPFQSTLEQLDRPQLHDNHQLEAARSHPRKPYFEVLVVHPLAADYEAHYRQQLSCSRGESDEFVYDIVMVRCAQDALTAVLANADIQACVYLDPVVEQDAASNVLYARYTQAFVAGAVPQDGALAGAAALCQRIRGLRPELDHYLISEQTAGELPSVVRRQFDRVLHHVSPLHELHGALLAGVRNRYSTPFFDALQAYSRQPKSVFHALPLSRGASVKDSPWIHDLLDFYGDSLFLAETSSTQGGLDSLLDPTGAIKQAHTKAAETFGADSSYFVTNGTSTANKIVMQANVAPGDIVLVAADCHKSVANAVMLAGAYALFLETYPLPAYDMHGGVDLAQIKNAMLALKKQGRLHLLRQITLTNCTFDGLMYPCERYMMEILAIKPDVVFHWDEAWFAFAAFHPLYQGRTAMGAVRSLRQRLASAPYQRFHAEWAARFEAREDEGKWQEPLYPDPARVVLRVYATHSTHKTLTAFRQGSMIHVADPRFDAERFLESFREHTSTSPNYQIIASLDIGRRQAALEGYHRVRDAIALALQLRERIRDSALLEPYFEVLDDAQLVPTRQRAQPPHAEADGSLAALRGSWADAEFAIDPTHVTLNVGRAGIDGASFRQLLMTRYDIQVNKTSRHTVLFLINIGATQASIDYLMQVLSEMVAKFQYERRRRTPALAPVSVAWPAGRSFHPVFLPFADTHCQASDIRAAYFAATAQEHVDYLPLSTETVQQARAGATWVSAAFVTPYPPGFPVLVPGQIITVEVLLFFQHIKVREIHGFSAERGLKVFRDGYLAQRLAGLKGGAHG
ncbi:MAG: aminotransferase class I/II-fold pyridoxal phosphate-dependent enzyme [Rhodoferax sp.]